ncbi:NAD(P)/FAD-dependent oxidoreductase [Rhodococcus jostii]|uniref:NAD(P)/FAD-dependent oxidoreductase n=1 Tax=Rhodococcus jostii TaxID=132919 RepID=UPI00365546A6
MSQPMRPHRVVVIGSGFGGLFATKSLRRADVEVTLVSRTNHHLFQPLLYQLATGILSEGEIASPTRMLVKDQSNVTVQLGEVTSIDLADRTVISVHRGHTALIGYDSLIVSAGARQSYFGNDHFAEHAPGLKTIDDALELRGRILTAFDQAELTADPTEREKLLTFVVVGAGPTGVELAGQIAGLAHRTLVGAYQNFDTRDARILLLDAASDVLPRLGGDLGAEAAEALERVGVEIRLGTTVEDIDADGVTVKDGRGERHTIAASCKIWSAGVVASPLGEQLAQQSAAAVDSIGRIEVQPDLTLPGHPNVFVVGDMMTRDGLPSVAQLAIQSGRYAARQIAAEAKVAPRGKGLPDRTPFRYRDKGAMAIISRFNAVARIGKIELHGWLAWMLWIAVHIVNVVGFRSRIAILLAWMWMLLGSWRGHLTVTDQQITARNVLHQVRQAEPAPLPPDGHPGHPGIPVTGASPLQKE